MRVLRENGEEMENSHRLKSGLLDMDVKEIWKYRGSMPYFHT